MAHVHRFYIPPETPVTAEVALPSEEAHHALHVVRVRQGDAVALFDGNGREWDGTVLRATRHDAIIAITAERRHPPPPCRLTVIQSWIKRDKAIESIIQRGTEIGVSRFCFFPAARSERKPHGLDKWLRYAIESCKQCRRVWLPAFETADSLSEAVARPYGRLLIATNERAPVPIREAAAGPELAVVIGPEGDFTVEELSLALETGATPISLGPFTYRSETAATLAASLILYELGEYQPRPLLCPE